MSNLYDAIPPERKATYLQQAQEAVEAATRPVVNPAIEALGEVVVRDAEQLSEADAKGSQVVHEAQGILSSEKSVSDKASNFLKGREEHIQDRVDEITSVGLNRPLVADEIERLREDNFMSKRREYIGSGGAATRADIGGRSFGETIEVGQIGLQTQLWAKMTEQNHTKPDDQSTQA